MQSIKVYIETGKSQTIASALDWPGWCRTGRDVPSALQTLADYAPRYAKILGNAHIAFQAPRDSSLYEVVEHLKGNAATDFGAPAIPPADDRAPIGSVDLGHFKIILQACWQTFDEAVQRAVGRELRTGPRGGGRDLEEIMRHVLEADLAYLQRLGFQKKNIGEASSLEAGIELTRQASLMMLETAARGELPERGPRGGVIWPARYFVRRVAWHVVDHAWEIEDRVI